jgi:hypothetical protein
MSEGAVVRVCIAGIAIAIACTACASPPPPVDPPSPAPATLASGCDVVFHGIWTSSEGDVRSLGVTAENVSPAAVEFDLPDRCPAGALDFEGLTPGFDYYGTCAMGACPGPRAATHVRLQPGERRALASIALHVAGSSCTGPIARGYYSVRPVVPAMGPRTCFDVAALDLRAEAVSPLVVAPVIAPTPAPAPAPPSSPKPPAHAVAPPPGDAYACTSPGDCVLSCPNPAGCCGWTCGCTHAIRRDHAEAFAADYAKTCKRPPACPAVDCAYAMPVGATCQKGRCAAAKGFGAVSVPP